MLDINNILDNSIIITPNNTKASILKGLDKEGSLKHIKYLTKEELIKGIGYSYDYDALVALHLNLNNEYTTGLQYLKPNGGFSYSNAKEILDNMNSLVTIDKSTGDLGFKGVSDKTKDLIIIYMKLLENNLITHDNLFMRTFDNKAKIYVYGYSEDDLELKGILDSIGLEYTYIKDSINTECNKVIKTFSDMDTEVMYLCNSIAELIKSGVALNDIFIYKLPSEYLNTLNKYMGYYKLKANIAVSQCLNSSPIYNEFINNTDSMSIEDAYNLISERGVVDDMGALDILASILVDTAEIKVAGKELSKPERLELISYLASTKHLKGMYYDNLIGGVDSDSSVKPHQHVFMLGFNDTSYPKIYKDVELLSDNERELLSLNTSYSLSKMAHEGLRDFILSTNNLHISFNKGFGKSIHYISALAYELKLKKEEGRLSGVRYSTPASYAEVTKLKDLKDKYDIALEGLNSLAYDKCFKPGSFDHSFKGLGNYHNDDELTLSHTAIDDYYSCPFKYFIKRGLGGIAFEDTFYTKMGSYFHLALELGLTEYLKDNTKKTIDWSRHELKTMYDTSFTTAKERFFINVLSKQIDEAHERSIGLIEHSGFNYKVMTEHKIDLKLDSKTKLTGSIDKAMLDEASKSFIVIDYKTGKTKFNPKEVKYGQSMQLLIYAKSIMEEFAGAYPIGFYIHNILEDKKTEAKNAFKYNKHYLLQGKTIDEPALVDQLDDNLKSGESNYIANLKYKTDGSLNNQWNQLISRDLDPNDSKSEFSINSLLDTVDKNVKDAIDKIRNGEFKINPFCSAKKEGEYSLPCSFCGCQDICFMDSSDIRYMNDDDYDKEDNNND